ncbi:MAG TPA: amidohydrolase family protein, partial [Terriglobales bacterium]|nr:amidohydrolase family protein [Terriglobales bacterium]
MILLITMSSLTLAAQTPAPVVLRGGKLLTVSHGVIENGVLVMENGKITALGKAGEVAIPKGARVLDVKGMTVYPGLIDSQTNLGLTEISAVAMTNDLVEPSDEITPHMHVYDAFHAESELIPVTRLNGITNAIVAPAETNTLPGQASLVQLDGRSRDEMLVVRDLALMMNFTGAQRRNQTWDSRKFPQTRMGLAAQLRQAFLDAQDYRQRRQEYEQRKAAKEKDPTLKDKERPKRDLRLEALLPYLDGKKPVVLAAAEPSDVEVALSLAREFNLQVVLNHITHSLTLLDKIAEAKLPVIVGPIYTTPKDNERYDVVYRLPAELARRGIKFAFASYDAHDVRNLPYAAGYAVAWGVPYDQALKALTLNPAEIWGVAAQLGSLDAGKTANIVVADGDPLDVRTDVKRLFIAGREVPLTSRQTAL